MLITVIRNVFVHIFDNDVIQTIICYTHFKCSKYFWLGYYTVTITRTKIRGDLIRWRDPNDDTSSIIFYRRHYSKQYWKRLSKNFVLKRNASSFILILLTLVTCQKYIRNVIFSYVKTNCVETHFNEQRKILNYI